MDDEFEFFSGGFDEFIPTAAEQERASGALQYPEKVNRLPGIAKFFVVDKNGNRISPDPIILPMPAGLQITDGAAYENAELGMIGAALGTQDDKTLEGIAERLSKANGRTISTAVVAKVGGNRARVALGETPNPNTRALFKQVNLRSFQISYKMMPSSAKEANNIRAITKAFRKELYPSSTGKLDEEDFEISYKDPNRFQIMLYLGNSEFGPKFQVKPRLKDAYLTNMTTAFGSTVFAENGSSLDFAETTISMTFMEANTLFSRDVGNGY